MRDSQQLGLQPFMHHANSPLTAGIVTTPLIISALHGVQFISVAHSNLLISTNGLNENEKHLQ